MGNRRHRNRTRNIDEYNTANTNVNPRSNNDASDNHASDHSNDDEITENASENTNDNIAGDSAGAATGLLSPRVLLRRLRDLRKDIPEGAPSGIPMNVQSSDLLDIDPGADARFNPQPDWPPSVPPASTTAQAASETPSTSAAARQAPETIEDEPMRDNGFFAPLATAPAATAPTSETTAQPAQPPPPPPPQSAPATPCHYFSDRRDGATATHSFSRRGRAAARPRPNLSAIASLINSHLKSDPAAPEDPSTGERNNAEYMYSENTDYYTHR